MGGSPNLLMPVTPAYTASWASHQKRVPKSTEPGTDMFVPIGTPVYAPADGKVYGVGTTIAPATGRWIGIDFDNGLRFRCLHLRTVGVSVGQRVTRGQLIGYSGASGYGYEDFRNAPNMPPAHTHVTLWPTHQSRFGYLNGQPFTVDFMQYVGGPSGGGSTPTNPEEDDMYDDGKHRAVLTAARSVKLYSMGTGVVAVGEEGGFWPVPSQAYLDLLIAWEIAGPNLVNRPIDENELTAMRDILRTTSTNTSGATATAARVESVLRLTPEDAERLASEIGRQPIVISEAALAEIAEAAAAGARDGGEDGARAAISDLSFVTTIAN